MLKKPTLQLAAAALALGALPLSAQDKAKKAPGPLSAEEIKASGEHYLVPSPAELLGAVGGSDAIDWESLSAAIAADPGASKSDYPIDAVKAANLGIRVADAFVALYAKNSEQFNQSASIVAKLAIELSEVDVAGRSAKVERLLGEGKWDAISVELESLRHEVIRELMEFEDQDSVTLAEVGGWLRGLELVSQSLLDSDDANASKVLRQGRLVNHLRDDIANLSASARELDAIKPLVAGLEKIDGLTTKATDATFTKEEVTQIRDTARDLISGLRG